MRFVALRSGTGSSATANKMGIAVVAALGPAAITATC
jgi:hypothetical protein